MAQSTNRSELEQRVEQALVSSRHSIEDSRELREVVAAQREQLLLAKEKYRGTKLIATANVLCTPCKNGGGKYNIL